LWQPCRPDDIVVATTSFAKGIAFRRAELCGFTVVESRRSVRQPGEPDEPGAVAGKVA
jgi:hypothetical protein